LAPETIICVVTWMRNWSGDDVGPVLAPLVEPQGMEVRHPDGLGLERPAVLGDRVERGPEHRVSARPPLVLRDPAPQPLGGPVEQIGLDPLADLRGLARVGLGNPPGLDQEKRRGRT
jgi:hypothetical protein